MPKVSILMPCFNQAWFIRRAIKSVAAQSYRDFELIVINDGSTDGLSTMMHDESLWEGIPKHLCLTRDSPGGSAAKAINYGCHVATGEYRTWISADNLMSRTWLEDLTRLLDMMPKVSVVYSGFHYVSLIRDAIEKMSDSDLWAFCGTHGRYLYRSTDSFDQINSESCHYGPSFLFRASLWDAVGEHIGMGSHDLDHWLRTEEVCEERGQLILGHSDALCLYLAHDERCVTADPSKYDSPEIIKKARKRRGLTQATP